MEKTPQWSLDLDHVRRILAQHHRPEVAIVTPDGPAVVYLPGGRHVLRWLFDPARQLYRLLELHQVGEYNTHCPDYFRELNPAATCPPCVICRVAAQRADWRLQRQKRVLSYGYLCATDEPNAFWQTGKIYLLVGPFRLFAALRRLLEQEVEHRPAQLLDMLNPLVPGPAAGVEVLKGLQGSVTISPFTTESFPPIPVGDGYKPLQECWLGSEFSLGQYHEVLAAITV